MSEQNRNVVRRWVSAFHLHDLDRLDDIIADDFAWHGASFGEVEGPQAFKQVAAMIPAAFPDLRVEEHYLVAEGDLVMLRNTCSGTHQAEFLGVPATGKRVTWVEHPVYRVVDGKVAEAWYVADIFGLMQQISTIPNG